VPAFKQLHHRRAQRGQILFDHGPDSIEIDSEVGVDQAIALRT
jgi:hypothetical protein